MTSGSPCVYVLDDDEALRDSLKELFASENIKVQTFVSAEAFLAWDIWKSHGCAIVDIHMRGMTGLELLHELKARGSKISVIIITGQADVSKAVAALKAGAVDFIEKPFDPAQLVGMVKKILGGTGVRQKEDQKAVEVQELVNRLSAREREVMDLVVAGHPNKVIAAMLGISARTVETHRAHMMEKMKCENVSSLIGNILHLQNVKAAH